VEHAPLNGRRMGLGPFDKLFFNQQGDRRALVPEGETKLSSFGMN
jgi:hypothetical protein